MISTDVAAVSAVRVEVAELRRAIDNDDVVAVVDVGESVAHRVKNRLPSCRRLHGERRFVFILLQLEIRRDDIEQRKVRFQNDFPYGLR